MSNSKQTLPGAAEGAQRATGEAPGTGPHGKGRWSAKRKMAAVLELLRGDDLETLSRNSAVTAATLPAWRDALLIGGEASLKVRQEDLVDEKGRRMKSLIADLTVNNERLRNRIQPLENADPSLKWRS